MACKQDSTIQFKEVKCENRNLFSKSFLSKNRVILAGYDKKKKSEKENDAK